MHVYIKLGSQTRFIFLGEGTFDGVQGPQGDVVVALGWKTEGLLFDGIYTNFEASDMISILLYKGILDGVGV